jgi:MerR family copper efflux transcriptional regulator
MRISELSAKTHVSVHRLRRYEADGLIESKRLSNGYRECDEKTVKHVIFIAMSREMGFSLPMIAEYLPRLKTGKLSAQDMIEAILARVAEIDQLMTVQQALRKKLMDHIVWFKNQARRKQ